jgi:hypothetical protein
MIGRTQMTISKEQMIAMVEYYLNDQLFLSALHPKHKATVVDQIRKSGERFVITFDGQLPKAPLPIREPSTVSEVLDKLTIEEAETQLAI